MRPSFILVVGVPGTGKTALATRLARKKGCQYLNLSWFVLEKGLWRGYDRERRSFIVDFDGLVGSLRSLSPSCYVFDTHWVEPFHIARVAVERVIVLRTEPLVLLERLERRAWPPGKVAENVEAELLGVLSTEALEFYNGLVWEVDTTGKSVEESLAEALESLSSTGRRCCIDWLSVMDEERLDKVLAYIERHKGSGH